MSSNAVSWQKNDIIKYRPKYRPYSRKVHVNELFLDLHFCETELVQTHLSKILLINLGLS